MSVITFVIPVKVLKYQPGEGGQSNLMTESHSEGSKAVINSLAVISLVAEVP